MEQKKYDLQVQQGERADANQQRQLDQQIRSSVQNNRQFKLSGENQLRDEYNTLSKPFQTLVPAYGHVKSAFDTEKPTAATDMAGIFGYMKVLDPTSVVREGEYATAQNAAGVPERIRNMFNKAIDGQILAPEQRKQFSDHTETIYQQAKKDNDKLRGQYTTRSAKMGFDPNNVITDFSSTYKKQEPDIQLPPEQEAAYQAYLKGGKK
jgi:hypothetical protein